MIEFWTQMMSSSGTLLILILSVVVAERNKLNLFAMIMSWYIIPHTLKEIYIYFFQINEQQEKWSTKTSIKEVLINKESLFGTCLFD